MPKKANKKFFINLTFNLSNKMPISLISSEVQSDEEASQANTGVIKRKLKKTTQMVDEALIEMHSPKGVTLKQIYSFILNNYNMESLSHNRMGLIKKHLISLRESDDLINKTGRGFNGHLKLVDKKEFIKKQSNATTKRLAKQKNNSNTTSKTKKLKSTISVQRAFKKTTKNTEQIAPVVPRQVTPPVQRANNVSMFDTPIIPTQVHHASTPFIGVDYVPPAPAVTQLENRKRTAVDELGTPRTSLPGKKRRLLKRLE